jgi:hypothetical protein
MAHKTDREEMMRLDRDQIQLLAGTTGIILFALALVIVRNL